MRFTVPVLLAALAFVPAGHAARERTGLVQQTAFEWALLQDINGVRADHGLRPLTQSMKLGAAAREHTREMGVDGYFDHNSYDATPFWQRIERWYPSRGRRFWSVGENILWESPDIAADEIVDAWMRSPHHRVNVLSRTWREIGVSAVHYDAAPGEFSSRPVTIITADFGARRY